jgi:predicted nucleic acid-binding protein
VSSSAICDANVAVFWLVDNPLSDAALAARARYELAAPRLLLSEAANALRAYVRAGLLPLAHAQRHLTDLPRQIDLRDEHGLLPMALSLAVEKDHAAYDCLYVAMAMSLALPLVTADVKLARKFADTAGADFITLQDWTA